MSEWIPVSERLPQLFEEVIALGNGDARVPALIFNAWRQPEQGGTPVHWMMFGRIALRDEQVTAWMPKPSPPCEGENKR